MKVVLLLRHAKAEAGSGLADRDRPLAAAGIRDASRLAGQLRQMRAEPAVILCSTALRTRQTLDLVMPGLDHAPAIMLEDDLYGAGVDDLQERIARLDDRYDSVMLVGHNPGLHELTVALLRRHDQRHVLNHGMPTCALARVAMPARTWREVQPGTGDLIDLTRP